MAHCVLMKAWRTIWQLQEWTSGLDLRTNDKPSACDSFGMRRKDDDDDGDKDDAAGDGH